LVRLCRNLDDLRRTVKVLTGRGIAVNFHKEGLTFTGEDSSMSNVLLSMLGAVAGKVQRPQTLPGQRGDI
jgi:DNA invertase Pin-like site-specific DNA recombinase